MGVSINQFQYATRFESMLAQKYANELATSDLTDQGVSFVGAKTVKIPTAVMGGYKPHDRDGGFTRGTVALTYKAKELQHDRSVEFFVDAMDVDETNQAATAAKLTNVFVEEQAIPELDAYRMSKMWYEYTEADGSPDDTELNVNNVLIKFDNFMEALDDEGVPSDGRILYVTPRVSSLIKNAVGIYRTFGVQSGAGQVDRIVSSLDNVKIRPVPSGRMRTSYVFTDGFTPAGGADYINMVLLHPSAVIATQKHSAIYLWPAGQHQKGDGWLYQNRSYGDLFLIDAKIAGIKMNVTSDSPPPPPADPDFVAYEVTANGSSGTKSDKIEIVLNPGVPGLEFKDLTIAAHDEDDIDDAKLPKAITDESANAGTKYKLALTADPTKDTRLTVVINDSEDYIYVPLVNEVTVYKQG